MLEALKPENSTLSFAGSRQSCEGAHFQRDFIVNIHFTKYNAEAHTLATFEHFRLLGCEAGMVHNTAVLEAATYKKSID